MNKIWMKWWQNRDGDVEAKAGQTDEGHAGLHLWQQDQKLATTSLLGHSDMTEEDNNVEVDTKPNDDESEIKIEKYIHST